MYNSWQHLNQDFQKHGFFSPSEKIQLLHLPNAYLPEHALI